MRKPHYLILTIFLLVILSGCSVSLAADVTPPPNLVQPSAVQEQPTIVPSVILPMMEPDIMNGAIIYQQKCEACHGESGMGDGSQSGQLPNPVSPLGDLNIAKDAIPFDWYRIITVGNIERFMPGFQSLNDRERWDVTAYALTLSLTEDLVNKGEEIFSENCVECHTEENLPLKSASSMAEKSLSDIVSIIDSGNNNEMHPFSEKLNAEDQLAAASYVRYLGFTQNEFEINESGVVGSESPEQPENETNSPEPTTFSIVGKLVNLETNTGDLVVTLTAYDGMEMVFQRETKVSNDGDYKFEDLENISGRIYQASLVIDGIQHTSDVLHDPTLDALGIVDLPISISKTSVDASALYAERMHVFFDFISENSIQVVEMYVIQNPTDTVIVPENEQTPVVSFRLPEGAQNLQFENGILGREFIQLEDGFGAMQTFGANSSVQILYAFELPYEKSLDLDIHLPFKVNASIFMLPSNSVKFSSEQLVFSGERDIQGMKIQTYSGGVMEGNDSISLNISGKVKDNISVVQSGDSTSLIIGGTVLLLTVIMSVVYFRQKLNKKEDSIVETNVEDIDSMIDAVIALDDAFEKGEIPEDAYYNRRNELTKLIKLSKQSEE